MAGGGVAFSQALENQGTGEPVVKYGTGGRISGGVRRFDVGGDTTLGAISNADYSPGDYGFNDVNTNSAGGAYDLGINPVTGAARMDFTGMATPTYTDTGSAPGSLDYGPAATPMPSGGVYDILNGSPSSTVSDFGNWSPLTVGGQNLTPDQYAGAADTLTVNNAGISGLDTLGNLSTSGEYGGDRDLSGTNNFVDTGVDTTSTTTGDTSTSTDTTGDTTADTSTSTDTTSDTTGDTSVNNTGSDALDAFLTLNNNFVDDADTDTVVPPEITPDVIVDPPPTVVTPPSNPPIIGEPPVVEPPVVPPTTTTNRNIYRPQYQNYADPLTMFNVSNYGRDLPTSAGYNYAAAHQGIGALNQNLRDIADMQMAQPGGANMNAILTAMRNSGLTAADLENARYGRTTGLNTPFSQYNKEAPTARTFGGGISELIKKLPS